MATKDALDGAPLLGTDAPRRARGTDPRTLLSEDAADLLATTPPPLARAFLGLTASLLAATLLWAALARIEQTVVARGELASKNLVRARVPASSLERLEAGQRARVRLGSEGAALAARMGTLREIEGPVADATGGIVFVATISVDDDFVLVGGEHRPLPVGAIATVEIATGETTTPLAWLLGRAPR